MGSPPDGHVALVRSRTPWQRAGTRFPAKTPRPTSAPWGQKRRLTIIPSTPPAAQEEKTAPDTTGRAPGRPTRRHRSHGQGCPPATAHYGKQPSKRAEVVRGEEAGPDCLEWTESQLGVQPSVQVQREPGRCLPGAWQRTAACYHDKPQSAVLGRLRFILPSAYHNRWQIVNSSLQALSTSKHINVGAGDARGRGRGGGAQESQ